MLPVKSKILRPFIGRYLGGAKHYLSPLKGPHKSINSCKNGPNFAMKSPMTLDQNLKFIVDRLKKRYKCHTAVLYGSRARGDFGPRSDYDVIGFSKFVKAEHRENGKRRGQYLDVFIYPDSKAREVSELLHLRGGRVLFERKHFGTSLIAEIEKVYLKGPGKISRAQKKVRVNWAFKMFERSRLGDIEAHFRKYWLLMASLEDYFVLRNRWYFGSKQSLLWLKENDAITYDLFEKAFADPANYMKMRRLLVRVTNV